MASGFLDHIKEEVPFDLTVLNGKKYLSNLLIVLSCTDSEEWPRHARDLCTHMLLNSAPGTVTLLLDIAIEQEIISTSHVGQLFREDSLYIFLIREILSITTIEYLRTVVGGSPGSTVLKNASKTPVPIRLQNTLIRLRNAVREGYREMQQGDRWIITFFFLHYVCPAVADPHRAKIQGGKASIADLRSSAKEARYIQKEVNAWLHGESNNLRLFENLRLLLFETTATAVGATREDLRDHLIVSSRSERLLQLCEKYDTVVSQLVENPSPAAKASILAKNFGKNARVKLYSQMKSKDLIVAQSGPRLSKYARIPDVLQFGGEDALEEYFELLRVSHNNGTISLTSERLIMLPARSLASHLKKVFTSLRIEGDVLAHCLYRLASAMGQKEASILQDHTGGELSREQLSITVFSYLALLGWGRFVVDQRNSKLNENDDDVYFVATATYSFESFSENRKESSKGGNKCVCHLVRGFLAGWLSFSLMQQIDAVEVYCSAGESCVFVISSPKKIKQLKTKLMKQHKSKHQGIDGTTGNEVAVDASTLAKMRAAFLPGHSAVPGESPPLTRLDLDWATCRRHSQASTRAWDLVSDPVNAGLWVTGKRVVLVNTSLLTSALHAELQRATGFQDISVRLAADGFFYTLGSCCGHDTALMLRLFEEVVADTAVEYSALPGFAAFYGLGRLSILPGSFFAVESESFCVIVQVHNTWESDASLCDNNNCAFTAGALAGWINQVRGATDIHCVEVQCLHGRQGSCLFLLSGQSDVMRNVRAFLMASDEPKLSLSSLFNGRGVNDDLLPEAIVERSKSKSRLKTSRSKRMSKSDDLALKPHRSKRISKSDDVSKSVVT